MSSTNIPAGAMVYTQGYGSSSTNQLSTAVRSTRAPGSTDVKGAQGNYSPGQLWVDTATPAVYVLGSLSTSAGVTSATWLLAALNSGDLETLTGDSGGAVSPTDSNINIVGTADQITVIGDPATSTITIALAGGDTAIDSIGTQTGTNPISATAAGLVTINGATVAAGTNPVRTDGTGANTMAVEVQISQALAATDATKIGLCNFNSTQFAVDANGFVTLAGGGTAIDEFIPDAGTNPVVPSAGGAVTMAGTASQITTTGGLNSLTFSLPTAIVAPGSINATTSIESTTTMTAGQGLTATTGNITASAGDLIATLGNISANAGGVSSGGGLILSSRSWAANDVTVLCTNSDNTDPASRSGVEIAVGGASGGDPYLSFEVSGVGASTMTLGLDNSASDLFVISNSSAVGTSNALTLTQAGALTATTSIASTTTMTCGTGLTVTTGGILVSGGDIVNSHANVGTDITVECINSDNTNGASRAGLEVVTGGASSGDPYLSFQVTGVAASTMSMGLDNSASDLFVISNDVALGTANALTLSQAGALNATTSITAGTTLTATLGAITATNGNLVLNTAGNKIVSTSVGSTDAAGANSFGAVTLVNGTVTVATTAVTANSIIILTRQTVGTTGANDLGILSIGTIVAATSFVINAWTVTNATALQADDQSVIGWMIIN